MDKEKQHTIFLAQGYYAGKNQGLENLYPKSDLHPLFVHGWMMGQSDLLSSLKIIRHPIKTAQESREIYNYIKAVLEDEDCNSNA